MKVVLIIIYYESIFSTPLGVSGEYSSKLHLFLCSPEAPPTSPKAQRRIAKKPAPPPPPDRSYNVAVTASVSKISGNSTQSSQTWPRSAPLASPESPPESGANITAEGDRHKHSPQERRTSTHGGERPHGPPPDRPNAPPPDRPKGPSTMQSAASHLSSVQPSGHQRSASAGAIIGPGVPVQGMATLPGSASSHEHIDSSIGTSLTSGGSGVDMGGGVGVVSGTSTLGRYSSMRPNRPNPPPPPPPINQQNEDTHL